jgi:hypothetical protein
MKTLDEFLDEIERECCSPYSLTAAKIIREFMYFVGSRFGKNSDLETEINKILNEYEPIKTKPCLPYQREG